MDLTAVFWHIANLFLTPVGLGLLSAGAGKLVWRHDLAAVPLLRLAAPACAVSAMIAVGGVALTGRDGSVAAYAAMIAGNALTLWWRGFGPGRR